MRILEMCLGVGLGGLELYFHRCSLWFRQSKNHQVYTITREGTQLNALTKKAGLQNFDFSAPRNIIPLGLAYRLAKIINEHSIDIVHIHFKNDLPLLAWAKMLSKRKFKLAYTRHMQISKNKKDPYHRFLYGRIDVFITITDVMKQEAERRIPINHKKIVRLYHGVKAADPSHAKCHELGLSLQTDQFKIGVFSRIHPNKGQHLVIEAARILNEKQVPLYVEIRGNTMKDYYLASLQDMITRYQLEDAVTIKPFHPNPLSIMPCFDVIILPSEDETFGLVLVEAMRAGVAVIGTNAVGVPEIISHDETGLLFEWGDFEQLADQLLLLYQNPEKRSLLARNGKIMADKKFNHQDHFRTLEHIFQELIP